MAVSVALAAGVARAEPVKYRDYDATTKTFTNAVWECTLVTAETRTLSSGWYAVRDVIDFPMEANLTVTGTVHLILCDDASLAITNVEYTVDGQFSAVTVTGKNQLTVYGQAKGTGLLTAWASVEFVPSEDVAGVLTTGLARSRYAGWFDFDITSKAANEWYVEAVLSDAAKTRLAETATKATRQIPVADIAALTEGTKDVPVEGCEPGFYYTLRGSGSLEGLEGLDVYGPELSGVEGTVLFPAVEKPSAAAGFFTIGVSATRGE